MREGKHQQAERVFEQVLQAVGETGEENIMRGEALLCLGYIGIILQRDWEKVIGYLNRAAAELGGVGDHEGEAMALMGAVCANIIGGEYASARDASVRAVTAALKSGNEKYIELALSLANAAESACGLAREWEAVLAGIATAD